MTKKSLKILLYTLLVIFTTITLWFTVPLKFRAEDEYGFKLPESTSLNWQILSPKRTLDMLGVQTPSDFSINSSSRLTIDTNELNTFKSSIEAFSNYAHKPPVLTLENLKNKKVLDYHVIPKNQKEFASYLFITLEIEKELIIVNLSTNWN